MKYRIVIPLFNEEKHIEKLINTFPEKHIPAIIFVNDGSTDRTKQILKKFPHITSLHHKINLGKGKSLETGALKALKDNAKTIIFMDGDLQHKPQDIDRFLSTFSKNKEVEIIFGARKINKTMKLMPFLGNKILTVSINLLYKYLLNDTQCGFRGFRSRIFEKIRWKSSDYSAETEMIVNSAKNSLKYKEISIDTIYHDHHKGTYLKDGIIVLTKVVLWKIFK